MEGMYEHISTMAVALYLHLPLCLSHHSICSTDSRMSNSAIIMLNLTMDMMRTFDFGIHT